ncbi:MAG: allantoicase [Gammaproteobacteria bacterium]|nr:allantoicase [Gammaproteobacteria bacterium]MCY4338966.1 allantoicase [Gammaproteobacteria bacterium]
MSEDLRLQDLRHAFADLADERMGSKTIYCTDEFFAPVENLLKTNEPISIPDKFTDEGKWMDGWESRRRRGGGHDYCIVQFGISGIIKAVDVDTRHFTGNYPAQAALDVCNSTTPPDAATRWTALIPRTRLQGDAHNLFASDNTDIWTHARLNIYPDGGVARLRIYGNAYRDWSKIDDKQFIDLAGVENGGRAVACNDEHFGSMGNIIMPGRGLNMGDGWETRRRRDNGHDWLILQLGHAGIIDTINVDTAFFRGNYPDRVSLDALYRPGLNKDTPPPEGLARHDAPGRNPDALLNNGATWQPLLTEQKLRPDREHLFKKELQDVGPVSHIRVNIHPDGGISRLRAYGYKYTK